MSSTGFRLICLHLTSVILKVKVKVMHFLNVNILQTMTDRTDVAAYWLLIDVYIWPWPILKVEVMHNSTVNITQTVRDRTNIAIANTHEAAYWLSISIFTFDLGQGHAYFDCEYLAHGDR